MDEKWIIDPIPREPNYRVDSTIDLTLTVSDLTEAGTGRWNRNLISKTFTPDDEAHILQIRPQISREDSYKTGNTPFEAGTNLQKSSSMSSSPLLEL